MMSEVQATHWDECWRSHHECAIAKIERLQKALRPFAVCAEHMTVGKACAPEDLGIWTEDASGVRITVADFQAAAEAVGKEP